MEFNISLSKKEFVFNTDKGTDQERFITNRSFELQMLNLLYGIHDIEYETYADTNGEAIDEFVKGRGSNDNVYASMLLLEEKDKQTLDMNNWTVVKTSKFKNLLNMYYQAYKFNYKQEKLGDFIILKSKTANVIVVKTNKVLLLKDYCYNADNNILNIQQNLVAYLLAVSGALLFKDIKAQLTTKELNLIKRALELKEHSDIDSILSAYKILIKDKEYRDFLYKKEKESLCKRLKRNNESIISRESQHMSRLFKDLEDRKIELIENYNTLLVRQDALLKTNSKDAENIDYLYEHPYLEHIHLNNNNNKITAVFAFPLINWDTDALDNLIYNLDNYYASKESIIYKKMKCMLTEIFVKQTAQYMVKVPLDITLGINLSVTIQKLCNIEPACHTHIKATPNLHLESFLCTGTYQKQLLEATEAKDFVTLLETSLATAKNWNFADGVVTRHFFNYIEGHKSVAFILYKDSMYTLSNFYKQMLKENGDDQNE